MDISRSSVWRIAKHNLWLEIYKRHFIFKSCFNKLRNNVNNGITLICAKSGADVVNISNTKQIPIPIPKQLWPRFFGPPCTWLANVCSLRQQRISVRFCCVSQIDLSRYVIVISVRRHRRLRDALLCVYRTRQRESRPLPRVPCSTQQIDTRRHGIVTILFLLSCL